MQASNLGYQTWVLAIYLLTTSLKGQSSMKLHRDLNITQKSAWFLAYRIRKAFANQYDGERSPVSGPVEVDETYMGGKRSNMSNAQRKALADVGAGRGAAGKTAVAGAKDRATNQAAAGVASSTSKSVLQDFVGSHVADEAVVYTDGASVYDDLPNPHKAVNHSVMEFVRGDVHTNGVESFWSMLKRGYKGIYHKMSPKHLDRYVQEFAGRHNFRNADTLLQMGVVVRALEGRHPNYTDLTEPNGLSSGARS